STYNACDRSLSGHSFRRLGAFRIRLEAIMVVGEIHVRIPVVGSHIMLSRSEVITNGALNLLARFRHLFDRQPVGSQETVDRVGSPCRQEFSLRVSPEILLSTTDQHGTG